MLRPFFVSSGNHLHSRQTRELCTRYEYPSIHVTEKQFFLLSFRAHILPLLSVVRPSQFALVKASGRKDCLYRHGLRSSA